LCRCRWMTRRMTTTEGDGRCLQMQHAMQRRACVQHCMFVNKVPSGQQGAIRTR
jgi:hypothetical protein